MIVGTPTAGRSPPTLDVVDLTDDLDEGRSVVGVIVEVGKGAKEGLSGEGEGLSVVPEFDVCDSRFCLSRMYAD